MGGLKQIGAAVDGRSMFLPPTGPARQRKNHALGTHAPDGRPYLKCPMCSDVASLSTAAGALDKNGVPAAHESWTCESCGMVDCDSCSGGRHDLYLLVKAS